MGPGALRVGAVWYVPFGTLLSVVQLVLLGVLRAKGVAP